MMQRSLNVSFLTFLLALSSTADQANILNNGNFETGLMCYQNWIWSQTYQDFKGDYKFALSPDAHSGSYSLEIRCAGADCMRAAIFSNKIPTTPGQAYKLKMYSKCPPNTKNFAHIPDAANGSVTQYLTCNGDWASNEINFQSAAGAQDFFFYVFNADVSWLRVDDIVLTYADGTAPPRNVVHQGARSVNISGQNVMVDGTPFLSLGFANVGYDDLSVVAAAGANTVNGLGNYSNADCFNAHPISYLDHAYDLGLKFVGDSTFTARLGVPAVFPAVMQTFASHLSVVAWQLADEPDIAELPFEYIPPATLTAEYNAMKGVTSLPITSDFQHAAYDSPYVIAPFAPSVDFWTAEPYGTAFWSVAHATNLFNTVAPHPVWFYQDAIDASLIVPKAYWAIVNGVTGIHYFDWGQFKSDTAKFAAVQQVFSELKTLNNAIFASRVDERVSATNGVAYTARYDSNTDSLYVISVNAMQNGTPTALQTAFTVLDLPEGKPVTVMFENRSLTASGGGFSDAFTGTGPSRHVYMISGYMHPAGVASFSASILQKTGSDQNRDWTLQVTNSGFTPAISAQVSKVFLTQTGGPACSVVIRARGFPMPLGDIPPGVSVTTDLGIHFIGCADTSLFKATVRLDANQGATSQTILLSDQQQ